MVWTLNPRLLELRENNTFGGDKFARMQQNTVIEMFKPNLLSLIFYAVSEEVLGKAEDGSLRDCIQYCLNQVRKNRPKLQQ